MPHYDEKRWVDYVRGVSDTKEARELESHLESGCTECGEWVATFERLATLAAQQEEAEPPAHAVRSVKSYFSVQQAQKTPGMVSLLGLKLAFDSLAEPVMSGTRSLATASRQLVYYGNDYALTLRLDYGDERPSDSGVSLGGELLHRNSGPVANVPALLMSGHSVVGYSLSGELGDFHMNCGQDESLRLRMLVTEDQLIEIDLDLPQAFDGAAS